MKILKLSKFVFLMFGLALLWACSNGEDGAAGAQGEQGIQGEPGEDGNANVQSFLFENQSFSPGNVAFDIPAISQDILDYGVVLGYLKQQNATHWYSMPFYYDGGSQPAGSVRIYRISLGSVVITNTLTIGGYNFRFVVIEGVSGATSKAMSVEEELKQAGVDISDFYQVAEYYGLEY
ncbi:collagen-like protein [Flagellimonas oceanensis]|uniref:collagen-like protein n=1 Tax=Flagellimonas oceanensis TaxID=2499163 RepID=UPI000F8CDEFF|nr:collagen-like protein [Allomuricauda oceanensis]|tara:strand:- start:111 stop:644 length:534 start_codon:yes stop_codon:yes gene_type:complete